MSMVDPTSMENLMLVQEVRQSVFVFTCALHRLPEGIQVSLHFMEFSTSKYGDLKLD